MSNIFKTAMLLAVLTAMLVLLGGAIGGQQGMLVAFVLALAMNFVSYWFSDKIVLADVRRPARSTRPRRPASTRWSAGWPRAPASRCRAST